MIIILFLLLLKSLGNPSALHRTRSWQVPTPVQHDAMQHRRHPQEVQPLKSEAVSATEHHSARPSASPPLVPLPPPPPVLSAAQQGHLRQKQQQESYLHQEQRQKIPAQNGGVALHRGTAISQGGMENYVLPSPSRQRLQVWLFVTGNTELRAGVVCDFMDLYLLML